MRVTIVSALGPRTGRPSVTAMAGEAGGLIGLDTSATARLGGHHFMNLAKLDEREGVRETIENTATRLFERCSTAITRRSLLAPEPFGSRLD